MSGRVVTFYSFKGGVGRSLALANIAVVLAERGRRVLCVDWDLEAAGLHAYFRDRLPEGWEPRSGLIDVLTERVDWREQVVHVALDAQGSLDLLPAGSASDSYVERVQRLDWSRAYEEGLGEHLEALRAEWCEAYDFVLLDSRTGLSDIGGICTIQLPDVLVMLFSANRQSLEGTLDVARRAALARDELPVPRGALTVLPVPSRFEGRTEVEQAQRWLDRFATELEPLYRNWLDRRVTPKEILRHTRIPAVPRWSFDEALPVLEEDRKDPDTISYALEGLAALLDRGLADTAELVRERGEFLRVERGVDFGFSVSSNAREYATAVTRLLEGKGFVVRWFGEYLLPGDHLQSREESFVEDARVIVDFSGGQDGGRLVRLCTYAGKRFVPVLVDSRSKVRSGAEGLVPIRAGTPVEECASLLGRVLDAANATALPPEDSLLT